MDYTETVTFGTDTTTTTADTGRNWYEEFIENYDYQAPERGQVLSGEILKLSEDWILVDVGLKRDAIVPRSDIERLDDEFLNNLSVGDEVIVYVLQPAVREGEELLVSLSKGNEHKKWNQAQSYLENGTILDLKVIGENRGGLLVEFGNMQGFVPNSHVPELRRTNPQKVKELKKKMIGSTLPVKFVEVEPQRQRLVLSAQAAQEERRQQRLHELEKGQVIYQRPVVKILDFGVFVDLDGIDGLVHISELDWQKVGHPSDILKEGDRIDVQVIDVDLEKERVNLSRKALLQNPWEELEETHKPGDIVEGRVTKTLDFGAFVELPEGIEGLVHVSEIGYTAPGTPEEAVRTGEPVLVRILNIDPERERISLSMRQVPLEAQISWTMENLSDESSPDGTDAEATA